MDQNSEKNLEMAGVLLSALNPAARATYSPAFSIDLWLYDWFCFPPFELPPKALKTDFSRLEAKKQDSSSFSSETGNVDFQL